jgi:uncharacterized protein (UPF0335 family)
MTDATETAPRLTLQLVPDGSGGYRHEFRPAPATKPKGRKQRPAPDPIHANPDAAAQALRSIIERVERLREEQRGIAADIRDVMSEAKAVGFDTKGISAILKIRELDPHTRAENDAIIETYRSALGIE